MTMRSLPSPGVQNGSRSAASALAVGTAHRPQRAPAQPQSCAAADARRARQCVRRNVQAAVASVEAREAVRQAMPDAPDGRGECGQICTSVTARTPDGMLEEVAEAAALQADIVELRLDFLGDLTEPEAALTALLQACKRAGLPCIATYRPDWEGCAACLCVWSVSHKLTRAHSGCKCGCECTLWTSSGSELVEDGGRHTCLPPLSLQRRVCVRPQWPVQRRRGREAGGAGPGVRPRGAVCGRGAQGRRRLLRRQRCPDKPVSHKGMASCTSHACMHACTGPSLTQSSGELYVPCMHARRPSAAPSLLRLGRVSHLEFRACSGRDVPAPPH